MRCGSTKRERDPEEPHCSITRLYDPVVNSQPEDITDTEEETFCERRPLLNGVNRSNSVPARSPSRTGRGLYSGLSRSISVPLSRSNSVPSVSDGNTSGSSSSDESLTKLTAAQKKTLVFTAIADLLAYLSLSIMAPFFPEEALEKGISNTLSGWIFGTQPFVQFLMSPLCGKLMPYTGVKFTFIAGQFMSGGCTVLFGLLTYIDTEETGDSAYVSFIAFAFLLQIFKSLGTCATSTASFVFLAQEFDNVATVFGIGEVFVGLGLVVGPAVGGVLYGGPHLFAPVESFMPGTGSSVGLVSRLALVQKADMCIPSQIIGDSDTFSTFSRTASSRVYEQGGFILPFAVIGGLSLIVIPFMCWIIPTEISMRITAFVLCAPVSMVCVIMSCWEIDIEVYEDSGSVKIPFSKVLCSPKAIVTSLAIVVSTFSWSILDPTLEPHLRQFQLSPELVGVIFLVMAAAYAVSSPIWGWTADKMTEQRGLLIGGFLIACVGSLLIGPSSLIGFDDTYYELWLIILALVILGASISLSSIPTFNQYFIIFEDLGFEDDTRTYGLVAGLWMSMYSLGDFLGPSVGGFLLDNVGFNNMCNYTAGLCLAMALLVAVSWILDLCCRKKIDKTKDIEKEVEQIIDSFTNYKCYGANDVKELSG